jgi:hypothetical protein
MLPEDKYQQLIRIAGSDSGNVVTAQDLSSWHEKDIQQFEKEEVLLFRGYVDSIRCDRCHKGCSVNPQIARYPDGQQKGVVLCTDKDEGGRIEFEMKELRYWEINKIKLQDEGHIDKDRGQAGDKPAVQQLSQQVEWDENAIEYIPNSDAVKLADNKISLATLSKILKSDGPIRYMKKSQRCKVHIQDFRAYVKTLKKDITDKDIDDYIKGTEERKAAIREKKIK